MIPCPTEEEEQKTLYEWCIIHGIEMVHIPNERKCSYQQGARLKSQGVRSGFPDNFFPYPRGKYHGLFIEMKRAKKSSSRVSHEQRWWGDFLDRQGYAFAVCYGADMAIKCIKKYFNS